MKKYLWLLILCLVLVSTGCSSNNKKDDTGESRKTDHFSIEVEKVVSEPALKDDQLITLTFNVANSGKTDFAIGASDFYLKDSQDNKYKINGNHPNFGDDVKKGTSLKGEGFYQLPENETAFTVVYQPFKTVEAEWFIVLPKK
ncbi:conserved exported hypothetical protein [Carnobacterium maltaromaticum]|uniref:DUF4352 domain-containing protein n=1 Tax=Carnobacterium maltaromaticum TaxID=2751 RepID=A0AAW9K8L2_CARML|nr:DUF4352 domain-containing protein [Carnobacterium maltaromaticum]MDZ5759576.1 DUF4352 domain-containing protein [Carnobacterium maltaromaticum]CAD5897504.1 conserved exported hypothetical protein [Carnobacterium maltaromaticum]